MLIFLKIALAFCGCIQVLELVFVSMKNDIGILIEIALNL
jgi:hypothetical protein